MSVLAGKRIFIVEDEPMVAFALEDILLDLGCEVIGPAIRLAQAQELLATPGLDAAVLDVNINGDRSYGLADALEQRGVPYIFATGYGNEGIEDGRKHVPILAKPYRYSDIEAALTALIGSGHPAGG